MCLQETKLEAVSPSDVRALWGNHSIDFAALNAVGLSGGVLVIWDKSVYRLVSSFCGDFSITCILQMVESGFAWAFTCMYGPQSRTPQSRTHKLRFWEELRLIKDKRFGPCCVGGDFNEILHPHERSSGLSPSNSMEEFHNFTNSCALVDLPLQGVILLVLDVVRFQLVQDFTAFLSPWIGRNILSTQFKRGCLDLFQMIFPLA